MKITTVDHITINLLKVKESFEFYEKIFELRKIEDVDMGDHILHLYELPDARLELIEYKEEQRQIQTGNTDIGIYRHFAVCTDDLEELKERCKEEGYALNLEPTYIEQIKKTVMLVKDPNGVEIEVIQN